MIDLNASLYVLPRLRPCVRIEPEPNDGIRVGLEQRYSTLIEPLPLGGGDSMAPSPDGTVRLAQQLRAKFPWMEPAIAVLERQIWVSVWSGRPWLAWRPLCLVGDPGCGKSHFCREVAALSGLPMAALDLGAMHDAGAIVAVARGWTNTKPCWPAQMMSAFQTANPVLVLDEVEKAGGSDRNGEPHKAILAMLEPSTAARYFDTCLMGEIDLSAVCWIATANSTGGLPRPLASRLEIIHIDGPGPNDFDVVLNGILGALAARWQLPVSLLPELPERALRVLRQSFNRHRSLRSFKRNVEAVIGALLPFHRTNHH